MLQPRTQPAPIKNTILRHADLSETLQVDSAPLHAISVAASSLLTARHAPIVL
jgi:hypothetical protein